MRSVSIVGMGRFGKVWYRLLQGTFPITLYSRGSLKLSEISLAPNTRIAKNLSEVYESDTIFYAVPISSFEQVIRSHSKYFRPRHTLVSLLSVMVYPGNVLRRLAHKTGAQSLLTHPMFGPDSTKEGFVGLPIVLDRYTTKEDTYTYWKDIFLSQKLSVVEMSAKQHDTTAANSQGVTHFIGRLLEDMRFHETPIDTLGAKKLLQIKDQTCNDTWQLFYDLQRYNPYTKRMGLRLGRSYDKIYHKLLPKRVKRNTITYGIQGGKGSFNEEALMDYLSRHRKENYTIKYLYTTENVMRALHRGEIDFGQFAIHNSVGGIVEESIQAIARYTFKIIEEYAIVISHALMIRNDAQIADITSIMSHPQVFAQCKDTLVRKYPHLKLVSGEGTLIDHAKVAQALAAHKLPPYVATMGSKVLASLYDLTVVEDNLQDAAHNLTSFLLVSR